MQSSCGPDVPTSSHGQMKRPNRCPVILLRVMSRITVETRGSTVLESSTRPCLHGSITRPKSTALPKTVKPWHPFSQLFVSIALRPSQPTRPIFGTIHQACLPHLSIWPTQPGAKRQPGRIDNSLHHFDDTQQKCLSFSRVTNT